MKSNLITKPLILVLLFTVQVILLNAQAGRLDLSFGKNGMVRTSLHGDFVALTVQPDGKILSGGNSEDREFLLARFHPDGTPDVSFGTGGTGVVITKVGAFNDKINSMALQSDGKIIVGGWSMNSNFIRDFVVARYTTDGLLDESFGSGGIAKYDLHCGYGDYTLRSITLQPDGKIVAAGYIDFEFSGSFILVRYNADGSLDESFGTKGITIAEFLPPAEWAKAFNVAIQPDNKIVVSGYLSHSGEILIS